MDKAEKGRYRVLDFRSEHGDDLQVVEDKGNTQGKRILAGHLRNSGTQLAGPSLKPSRLPHLIQIRLRQHPKIFLKQVSRSESLEQKREEGQKFFLRIVS